jgi:hypothetical protein
MFLPGITRFTIQETISEPSLLVNDKGLLRALMEACPTNTRSGPDLSKRVDNQT